MGVGVEARPKLGLEFGLCFSNAQTPASLSIPYPLPFFSVARIGVLATELKKGNPFSPQVLRSHHRNSVPGNL